MRDTANEQRLALEKRVSSMNAEIRDCVQQLLEPGELATFVVAERLIPLGSALVPHLLALLKDEDLDDELLRGDIAELGRIVGTEESFAPEFLNLLRSGGPSAGLAATRLAQAKHPEVGSLIEDVLRRQQADSIDAIAGYLYALHLVTSSLPPDIREVLSSNPHQQVEVALEDYFPEE